VTTSARFVVQRETSERYPRVRVTIVRILVWALLTCAVATRPGGAQTFEMVFGLQKSEEVFAYSRVSPDGRILAYTSGAGRARHINVVDLSTKRVIFSAPGVDAYFSPDGKKIIYICRKDDEDDVCIYHLDRRSMTRNVAPVLLGDYLSWGSRDNKDIVLTIQSNYYYLTNDHGVMPAGRVPRCDEFGIGDRPLLSKDGRRVTTFVRGTIAVRNLTDCTYFFDTGIQGAKADFSWDSRYIAFHALRPGDTRYDVLVIDLEQKVVRTITSALAGSSYFPSWTRDGRLLFRHDAPDYQGFMLASDLLRSPAIPLPSLPQRVPTSLTWNDLFPKVSPPPNQLIALTIWSSWSAHSSDALRDLQRIGEYFAERSINVGVVSATDPGSSESEVARMLATYDIHLPRVPLSTRAFSLTEGANQIPTTLLFRDGRLIDRRLGAQTFHALHDWIENAHRADRPARGQRPRP
jgi:hypothetical protein